MPDLAVENSEQQRPPRLRMPATVQTLLGAFFVESFPTELMRRYAGARCLTMRLLGIGELVSVTDPQAVRDVFAGDREVLRAGQANAQMLGAVVGARSLLTLDGEEHLRMRRLLSPPLHGQALRAYTGLVEQITAQEVQRWPVSRTVRMLPRMQAITLEVILHAVLGVRDEPRRRQLRSLLPRLLDVNALAVVADGAYPGVAEGRLGALLPWVRARRAVDALLQEEIAAHRADPVGRDDVLALLLTTRDENGVGLSDQELRDQLRTLLVAGHETTAGSLSWCLERLMRHPEALARLQQEVDAGQSTTYLDAVIQETLRTRPVLEAVWRRLAAPLELAGYRLPAGSLVAVAIRGAHRSEAAFPEPQCFSPERFLGEGPAPGTHIPFGGGPRRCIGAGFALMEMRTVIRVVLERVELQAPSGRAERQTRLRSFTTRPARGARVVVAGRRAPVT